jgi:hypothetical protein
MVVGPDPQKLKNKLNNKKNKNIFEENISYRVGFGFV